MQGVTRTHAKKEREREERERGRESVCVCVRERDVQVCKLACKYECMVIQKKKRENGGTSKRVVSEEEISKMKRQTPAERVFKFLYVPRHTPIAEREDKKKNPSERQE
jgi:hypothetical protein